MALHSKMCTLGKISSEIYDTRSLGPRLLAGDPSAAQVMWPTQSLPPCLPQRLWFMWYKYLWCMDLRCMYPWCMYWIHCIYDACINGVCVHDTCTTDAYCIYHDTFIHDGCIHGTCIHDSYIFDPELWCIWCVSDARMYDAFVCDVHMYDAYIYDPRSLNLMYTSMMGVPWAWQRRWRRSTCTALLSVHIKSVKKKSRRVDWWLARASCHV